eukprot:6174554-Pleurochrysis_carterae.AAC.1
MDKREREEGGEAAATREGREQDEGRDESQRGREGERHLMCEGESRSKLKANAQPVCREAREAARGRGGQRQELRLQRRRRRRLRIGEAGRGGSGVQASVRRETRKAEQHAASTGNAEMRREGGGGGKAEEGRGSRGRCAGKVCVRARAAGEMCCARTASSNAGTMTQSICVM